MVIGYTNTEKRHKNKNNQLRGVRRQRNLYQNYLNTFPALRSWLWMVVE